MKYHAKKLFLYFLKSLIYIKRLLVVSSRAFIKVGLFLLNFYQRTIGFRIYGLFHRWKRVVEDARLSGSWFIEFIGKRSTLQIALFFAAFVVMIPYTRIYSQNLNVLPGTNTLLYTLVGPRSDGDAPPPTLIVESGQVKQYVSSTQTWSAGAVTNQQQSASGKVAQTPPPNLSSVSSGGTAITAPIIMPGGTLHRQGSSPQTPALSSTGLHAVSRSQIIKYTVRSGDTISGIAERFGISIATVLSVNNLTARSYIQPGQTLTILPTDGIIYIVSRGNTVLGIANKYDAKASEIIAYNNLNVGGTNLQIGQQLIIPGGKVLRVVSSRPIYRPSVRTVKTFHRIAAPPPSTQTPAGSGWLWPTKAHIITQYFWTRHQAIDIAGPIGTPVYATKSGRVITSQCGWNYGYGCYIIIAHSNGYHSLYAHSSKLLVSVGQYVTQGQTIMLIGTTGNSTGPHVHFEIRKHGVHINPLRFIRPPS